MFLLFIDVCFQEVKIRDCGELKPGDDWMYCDNDETEDVLPPFPADWQHQDEVSTVTEAEKVLHLIKSAGNFFFERGQFVEACRKYKKVVRYFNFLNDRLTKAMPGIHIMQIREHLDPLYQLHLVTCLNLAAVGLKLGNFASVKTWCDEVLRKESKNAKALYRRGQAEIELKNFDEAIQDLTAASRLLPNDKNILMELERAKDYWKEYHNVQKAAYKNLFERI